MFSPRYSAQFSPRTSAHLWLRDDTGYFDPISNPTGWPTGAPANTQIVISLRHAVTGNAAFQPITVLASDVLDGKVYLPLSDDDGVYDLTVQCLNPTWPVYRREYRIDRVLLEEGHQLLIATGEPLSVARLVNITPQAVRDGEYVTWSSGLTDEVYTFWLEVDANGVDLYTGTFDQAPGSVLVLDSPSPDKATYPFRLLIDRRLRTKLHNMAEALVSPFACDRGDSPALSHALALWYLAQNRLDTLVAGWETMALADVEKRLAQLTHLTARASQAIPHSYAA